VDAPDSVEPNKGNKHKLLPNHDMAFPNKYPELLQEKYHAKISNLRHLKFIQRHFSLDERQHWPYL